MAFTIKATAIIGFTAFNLAALYWLLTVGHLPF